MITGSIVAAGLGGMPGIQMHIVTTEADLAPVASDLGLKVQPTITLADCPPDLTLLFVPGEPQVASLAEDSPAMLWRGNTLGRCVYLNARMRAFWGVTIDQCSTFDWATSLIEDDHQAVFGPFAEGMSSQSAFECEGRYRRADGEIRILRTRATPYYDDDGRFAGMIGVNEDITELREAERRREEVVAQLKQSTDHHRAIADRLTLATSISRLAMSEHDRDLRYTWCHNVIGDPIGQTPCEAFGEETGRPFEEILRRGLSEPQSQELEITHGDGSIWLAVQASPVSRPDGTASVVASALDISARKQNEQKLEVLARELAHRVKNVFALVQAIVRQTARTVNVPEAFIESVDSRLIALSRAQDALLAGRSESAVLQDLLAAQVAHLERVQLEGSASTRVSARTAPYIALAVHELGTNAVKYGSLSHSDGWVDLSWTELDGGTVRLLWQEHGGRGRPPAASQGFGTQLLTRLFSGATSGQAHLELADTGLTWRAEFPFTPEA